MHQSWVSRSVGAQPPQQQQQQQQQTHTAPQRPGDCELVGPFSLVMQCVLGALALLALVYKRQMERPKRPSKVWLLDVSKQVLGSFLIHMTNLVASAFIATGGAAAGGGAGVAVGKEVLLSPGYLPGWLVLVRKLGLPPAADATVGSDVVSVATTATAAAQPPNPCSYYLLNLGIDTTIGIPILIVILRFLNYAATFTPLSNPPESIESGNYGSPPRKSWWLKQSLIYGTALLLMKTCIVVLIVQYPVIVKVGDWILDMAAAMSYLFDFGNNNHNHNHNEGNVSAQIVFVMLLFPAMMNAMQYCVIDMFIKKKNDAGIVKPFSQSDHHPYYHHHYNRIHTHHHRPNHHNLIHHQHHLAHQPPPPSSAYRTTYGSSESGSGSGSGSSYYGDDDIFFRSQQDERRKKRRRRHGHNHSHNHKHSHSHRYGHHRRHRSRQADADAYGGGGGNDVYRGVVAILTEHTLLLPPHHHHHLHDHYKSTQLTSVACH